MKAEAMSFFEWQPRFPSDEACAQFLAERRWPNGFICPQCGHDKAHLITLRSLYPCAGCRHPVSVTAGTIFHSTKVPLRKWFWAIDWISSDKGGISTLRLSKLLAISWPTAHRMLRKWRLAMGHRDSLYWLSEWWELDDALVGGQRAGKRGRGAERKPPIWVACEDRGERAGFLAMEAVSQVTHPHVADFAQRRLRPQHTVFTDALPALGRLQDCHIHCPRVTPPEQASQWLPWVHVAIANLKRFILGTDHGVSKAYWQAYLNEFYYRFNRRFWGPQLPSRLLNLCVDHAPIPLS
ncbi:IS1595 family transposase [Nitrosococcus wardiae]|uniref:IS1595 family transposase n=1 Tax=Nitrosococcus wardiae TaxID=1814290 RepID=A0A4P7BWP1_9GAMM|nr:IS1595 family transposase [Nitrosococcus wardiae]QBQ54503.1 IS1595 family transposase [Nitrosococcus wardiae]